MTKFSIMVDEVHRVLGWVPGGLCAFHHGRGQGA